MAGPDSKKRSHKDVGSKSKLQRPNKKQKKARQYHSDSDEEGSNAGFQPVDLLDSDNEDLDNAAVDDVSSGSESGSSSDSEADADSSKLSARKRKLPKKPTKDAAASEEDSDEPASSGEEEDGDEDEEGSDLDADPSNTQSKKSRSKRNDPDAFATSISKILSTKLSNTRRADPVLSRSAEAHQAAKEAVETALDSKARKHLREQKRLASEKGRVKDVLVGAKDEATGEPVTSTTEIQQTEKRLKKVAHRGVIMLFRAVREAQERGIEAEKDARKDGVVGVTRREEKVNEMSRQGFLDLIAGGGGKTKRGALEEA